MLYFGWNVSGGNVMVTFKEILSQLKVKEAELTEAIRKCDELEFEGTITHMALMISNMQATQIEILDKLIQMEDDGK